MDHEVRGIPELGGSLLIEVCWDEHIRGNIASGSATGADTATCTRTSRLALSLRLAHQLRVQSFILDDARCHFYKVYVCDDGSFLVCVPQYRGSPCDGCIVKERMSEQSLS